MFFVPLLFTIAMDTFSYIINKDINPHLYNPISYGNYNISHLLFADDLLTMGKATNSTLQSLKHNLKSLETYLELEVNKEKSSICFSKNYRMVEEFINNLDINLSSFPLKYLELSLIKVPIKLAYYNPFIDKLHAWLTSKKCKFLSLRRWFQLIKSSVNNYSSYT